MILALCTLASPALAVDGVIEINQATALAGVPFGDTPGFPVTLFLGGGSYRLTSDLIVPTDVSAIDLVQDVTLDLNGFNVIGSGSGTQAGLKINTKENVEIRNGTVRNFGSSGIAEIGIGKGHRVIDVRSVGNGGPGIVLNGADHVVRDCTVLDNGGFGIGLQGSSMAIGNLVVGNGGIGLSLSADSVYSQNVINSNAGGTVLNGVQMGTNVCDGNTTCP